MTNTPLLLWEDASKTPSVTESRIPLIRKLPEKESYADDTSKQSSSDSDIQKSTISMKKSILESKDDGKKRKVAAKTHEREVEDQSDVGGCSPAVNKGV